MRFSTIALAFSATLAATAASAQDVNLTGRYQCVAQCASDVPGQVAFVTQNGWELNLVNEVGVPSRAWINYPGRLWIERANFGAIYSPEGAVIQFDNGTIWQRAVELPPPLRVRRR